MGFLEKDYGLGGMGRKRIQYLISAFESMGDREISGPQDYIKAQGVGDTSIIDSHDFLSARLGGKFTGVDAAKCFREILNEADIKKPQHRTSGNNTVPSKMTALKYSGFRQHHLQEILRTNPDLREYYEPVMRGDTIYVLPEQWADFKKAFEETPQFLHVSEMLSKRGSRPYMPENTKRDAAEIFSQNSLFNYYDLVPDEEGGMQLAIKSIVSTPGREQSIKNLKEFLQRKRDSEWYTYLWIYLKGVAENMDGVKIGEKFVYTAPGRDCFSKKDEDIGELMANIKGVKTQKELHRTLKRTGSKISSFLEVNY